MLLEKLLTLEISDRLLKTILLVNFPQLTDKQLQLIFKLRKTLKEKANGNSANS